MTSSNRLILKDILEGPYPSGKSTGWITTALTPAQAVADEENFRMTQRAYFACVNTTAQAEAGLRPLIDLAAVVSTLYPTQSSANRTKREVDADRAMAMGKTVSYFETLGIQTFTSLTAEIDDYNPVSTAAP